MLSDDLLWHVARELGARDDSLVPRVIRWAPFADSKHGYPLEALMTAGVVVTATPLQLHLRPEEHDVLRAAAAAVAPDAPLAADFASLPERFDLDDGVEVRLHRRVRPTRLATALASLDSMIAAVGARPGGQASWLGLSGEPGCVVRQRSGGRVRLRCDAAPDGGRRTFLYLEPPPAAARICGRLEIESDACPPVELALSALDVDGTRRVAVANVQRSGPVALDLESIPPDTRLVLELDAGVCRTVLEHVTVTPRGTDDCPRENRFRLP